MADIEGAYFARKLQLIDFMNCRILKQILLLLPALLASIIWGILEKFMIS
jgi:hypothetical protein